MPIKEGVTKRPNLDQCWVTTNFLRDGFVLRELQWQKCQQRVCQHIDVIQTGQAGWMVLILQWKMMSFSERSALVTVLPVVNTQQRFLLGIYIEIIAVFTLILRYIFFGDFTQSSFRHNNFNDIFKLLG